VVRDPVCLMELDPRRAASIVTHRGHAYYFCSPGCRDKFLAHPELFLNKVPSMPLTVGMMGSASSDQPPGADDKAYVLGCAIAEQGFTSP